ncbi:MAG: aldose 1-epimerase [Isosphaeraceae bacterium]
MGQRISTEDRKGRAVYHLHDDDTGAIASILPSYGFNLFDLQLPAAGKVRQILRTAPGWADNPSSPGGNGTPVLFPFPNRIRNGKFEFGGKSYSLPANNGPNAIHGFAIDAPWDVVEHAVKPEGATIAGRYQISKNTPKMAANWPADGVLQMRYTLKGRQLLLDVTVSNPTADPLPWGFGIHPYFRLPFPPGEDLDRTSIVLPASKFWVLDQFLPTGEVKPVDGRLDFQKGKPIRDLKLDDVLTGLSYEQGQAVARLVDQSLNAEFRFGFDRSFREIVVYTPPNSPGIIAVEPYTQTTDAINLQPKGIDAGLRTLGHGESASLRITWETTG